jgi:hypothetical protein
MDAFPFPTLLAPVFQLAQHNTLAFLLMGVGTLLLLWGVRRGAQAAQRLRADPPKALGIVRGFRIAVIGLCLGAYGAGLWWRIDWLMTVALVICLEEIAESSFYIAALKRAPT